MKISSFIVFLSIVLSVYGLANYYIFVRMQQSLHTSSWLKNLFYVLFTVCVSSYIIGKVLERIWVSEVSSVFAWVGSLWFAFMLHILLILIVLDFVRLLNHWFDFYPSFITTHYSRTKTYLFFISILAISSLLFIGYLNTIRPKVTHLNLQISKKAGNLKQLKMVMASDIHLGSIVRKDKVERLVNLINAQQPDIVVFAGDMLDEMLEPVLYNHLGEYLKQIKAPMGVYACLGNHEYIGGAKRARQYLESMNVKILQDSVVKINNSFYLAGRDEKEKLRYSGLRRKELNELLQGVDKSFPVIVLDHQPSKLEQAEQNGVDLQLSGHTHNGQMFPFNYITSAIYEVSYGYKKKGNTNIYVSSGYGTAGPPVRTTGRSEIVLIQLLFQ